MNEVQVEELNIVRCKECNWDAINSDGKKCFAEFKHNSKACIELRRKEFFKNKN